MKETLQELKEAIDAGDVKRKEQILRTLNKVGMDTMTAMVLVEDMRKEKAKCQPG